jgi:hypothetical protein
MSISGSGTLHPEAPHHLPFFVTSPDTTDVLMVTTGLFLFVVVIGIGVLYFKLHALPEQMAHRGQKIQFELVAVLALLALFTHNHAFWVAGLLLALLPLPDFTTPLSTIAASLQKMASTVAPEAQEVDQAAPASAPAQPAPHPSDTVAQATADDKHGGH